MEREGYNKEGRKTITCLYRFILLHHQVEYIDPSRVLLRVLDAPQYAVRSDMLAIQRQQEENEIERLLASQHYRDDDHQRVAEQIRQEAIAAEQRMVLAGDQAARERDALAAVLAKVRC